MSDSTQAVTIVVSLLGTEQVVKGAGETAAAIKGLAVSVNGQNVEMVKGASVVSAHDKALASLKKTASDLNNTMKDWSSTLDAKVYTSLKRTTEAVGALTLGIAALGVANQNQMQLTTLAVSGYTGMPQVQSRQVAGYLRGLTGRLTLPEVSTGFQQLLSSGMDVSSAEHLMKSVADISSVTGGAGTASAITSAITQIRDTGRVDPRSIRMLDLAGVPATRAVEQLTGMSAFQMSNWFKSGAPQAIPGLIDAITNLTGPFANMRGGQQAWASGSLSGAFTSAKNALVYGVGDLLSGKIGGAGTGKGGVTSWVAGLAPQITAGIAKDGPQVLAFIQGLGRDLPGLERAGDRLLSALRPAEPAAKALAGAIVPMVTTFVDDAGKLARSPLVHFLEDAVTWGAKTGAVRTTVVDFLEVLLAYKAVSTVTGYVQGFLTTIKTIGTYLSGEKSITEILTGGSATMTINAGEVIVNGPGGTGPVVPGGGGKGPLGDPQGPGPVSSYPLDPASPGVVLGQVGLGLTAASGWARYVAQQPGHKASPYTLQRWPDGKLHFGPPPTGFDVIDPMLKKTGSKNNHPAAKGEAAGANITVHQTNHFTIAGPATAAQVSAVSGAVTDAHRGWIEAYLRDRSARAASPGTPT